MSTKRTKQTPFSSEEGLVTKNCVYLLVLVRKELLYSTKFFIFFFCSKTNFQQLNSFSHNSTPNAGSSLVQDACADHFFEVAGDFKLFPLHAPPLPHLQESVANSKQTQIVPLQSVQVWAQTRTAVRNIRRNSGKGRRNQEENHSAQQIPRTQGSVNHNK
ncbi:Hypothetical_protein [Hexamita inflata]|uniref:Hypothetical_protein n=1 Tax=Hexamita inflata TaxID=28002 RepID=A0AA86N4H0_9EUKA|nr:Hypothetical protein HINF_LOCUS522 [Hexamita inflata]